MKNILFEDLDWVGPIDSELGSGEFNTLHFGTADASRPPFLYVPIALSLPRSVREKIQKTCVIMVTQRDGEELIQLISTSSPRSKQAIYSTKNMDGKSRIYMNPRFEHVGEAHLTVAADRNLTSHLDELQESMGLNNHIEVLQSIPVGSQPLFDEDGAGIQVDMRITQDRGGSQDTIGTRLKLFRAPFYADDEEPTGPILLALAVQSKMLPAIRSALGLSPYPQIPGKEYIPHITIGYLTKVHSPFKPWS